MYKKTIGKLFCELGKWLDGCEPLIMESARIELLKKQIEQLGLEKIDLKATITRQEKLLLQCVLSYGVEKPSPVDIIKQSGIFVDNHSARFTIDMKRLNIPFTKQPILLSITGIPDTGSMDGFFDYGNNLLYIKSADAENHKIMVDWIAQQWTDSTGLQTVDCAYRIMTNEADSPSDFSKPDLLFAIHRLVKVGQDDKGRFFWFAGINNFDRDPYPARDVNILWLSTGVIY